MARRNTRLSHIPFTHRFIGDITLCLVTVSTDYIHLQPGTQLPAIAEEPPFRVVLVAESEASSEWKASVSSWLVKSGCLYFLAWGRNCEAWHDCVDRANIEQSGRGEIPDEKFVMTTWHTKDPLAEVFWIAKNNAVHPTVNLARTLLVHISPQLNKAELLWAYADA